MFGVGWQGLGWVVREEAAAFLLFPWGCVAAWAEEVLSSGGVPLR